MRSSLSPLINRSGGRSIARASLVAALHGSRILAPPLTPEMEAAAPDNSRFYRRWLPLFLLGCLAFLYLETFVLPDVPRVATGDRRFIYTTGSGWRKAR